MNKIFTFLLFFSLNIFSSQKKQEKIWQNKQTAEKELTIRMEKVLNYLFLLIDSGMSLEEVNKFIYSTNSFAEYIKIQKRCSSEVVDKVLNKFEKTMEEFEETIGEMK